MYPWWISSFGEEVYPLKFPFFVWKLVRRVIPIDVYLQRRGFSLASRCPCYFSAVESVMHLFVTGPVAQAVWRYFGDRFGILEVLSSSISATLVSWFCSSSLVFGNHIRVVVPLLILWFI